MLKKIFLVFIGCVLLFGTSTAWGDSCTTDEDCGYPTVYARCMEVAGSFICLSLYCPAIDGETGEAYDNCPTGYTCLNNTCRKIGMPSTCFTKTCSTDANCTSHGYTTCTNGCCTGFAAATCTTCACTNDTQCTRSKCSAVGSANGFCVNGYCVGDGGGVLGGTYNTLAQCQNRADCSDGTSCQLTVGGKYACLPYCETGNFYVPGVDCGCESCSAYVTEAYADAYLTTFATATVAAGHESITECYIPAGTYYDERGTFSYSSDCYYTDDGSTCNTLICSSNKQCIAAGYFSCVDGCCSTDPLLN